MDGQSRRGDRVELLVGLGPFSFVASRSSTPTDTADWQVFCVQTALDTLTISNILPIF
jgi:hypothetical protein